MFRAREITHPELGRKILDNVANAVAAVGKVESSPKLDGRNMIMVLAPDKKAQAAAKAPHSADEAELADVAPEVPAASNEE
jgi:translation initiation factor IF-3